MSTTSTASSLEARLKEAEEGLGDVAKLSAASPPPAGAVEALREVALGDPTSTDAEVAKVKDKAIQKLADVYAAVGNAEAVAGLLTDLRPSFSTLPKAKTAKIVRTVIDTMAKVPNSTQLQVLALLHISFQLALPVAEVYFVHARLSFCTQATDQGTPQMHRLAADTPRRHGAAYIRSAADACACRFYTVPFFLSRLCP